jgi:hypothetical protein
MRSRSPTRPCGGAATHSRRPMPPGRRQLSMRRSPWPAHSCNPVLKGPVSGNWDPAAASWTPPRGVAASAAPTGMDGPKIESAFNESFADCRRRRPCARPARRSRPTAVMANLRSRPPNRTGIARHNQGEPFLLTFMQVKGTIVSDQDFRLQRLRGSSFGSDPVMPDGLPPHGVRHSRRAFNAKDRPQEDRHRRPGSWRAAHQSEGTARCHQYRLSGAQV